VKPLRRASLIQSRDGVEANRPRAQSRSVVESMVGQGPPYRAGRNNR
jgi:hypothetical protein